MELLDRLFLSGTSLIRIQQVQQALSEWQKLNVISDLRRVI